MSKEHSQKNIYLDYLLASAINSCYAFLQHFGFRSK
jgi:hypothetical protein